MLVLSHFLSIFSLNRFSSLHSVRSVLEPIDSIRPGLISVFSSMKGL